MAKPKATPERFRELAETAVQILLGKASIAPDYSKRPHKLLPGERKHGPEKVLAIYNELKESANPDNYRTIKQIAEKHGVSPETVQKISTEVYARTGKRRLHPRFMRDPAKRTRLLTDEQIQRRIILFQNRIYTAARNLCQKPFIKRRYDQQTVIDYITDLLRWKLQTFDPNEITGGSFEDKVLIRCGLAIRYAYNDIKKSARRKPGYVEMKPWTQPSHEKKELQTVRLPDIINTLTENGLTRNERAIVLASLAGLNQRAIGRIIGVNQSMVHKYWENIKPKIGLAGPLPVIRSVRPRPRRPM